MRRFPSICMEINGKVYAIKDESKEFYLSDSTISVFIPIDSFVTERELDIAQSIIEIVATTLSSSEWKNRQTSKHKELEEVERIINRL